MATGFDFAHQIGKAWALPRQIKTGDGRLDDRFDFAIEYTRILRTAPMFGYKRGGLRPSPVGSQEAVNVCPADSQRRHSSLDFRPRDVGRGRQRPNYRFPRTR